MTHAKILFLDIDGVLNSLGSAKKFGTFEVLDVEAVRLLRRVTEKHQAEIVITSLWRIGSRWLERINTALAKAGWENPPIIDRTPDMSGQIRGKEIQAWLDANPTESFVIIDDEDDMKDEQMSHFVRCDNRVGFTESQVRAIEKIWH